MTLTKKELTRAAKDSRAKIGELCKELDTEMKPMRGVCADLSEAREKYASAKAAYERKSNDKNTQKLARAKEAFGTAWTLYSDTYDKIDARYKAVLLEYDRLIEIAESLGDKELSKARGERDIFITTFDTRLAKARGDALVDLPSFLATSAPVAPIAPSAPTAAPTESVTPAPTAPAPATPAPAATPAPSATATVASVGIAPVTIDISAYVERAISATMDRLTVAMERKIDEYIAGLEIPAPVIPAPVVMPAVAPSTESASTADPASVAPVSEPTPTAPVEIPAGIDSALADELAAAVKANNEMLRHLIDEQNHVYEKLRGMISSVEKLVGNISDLGATYADLIAAHSALEDIMKSVMKAQKDALAAEEAILREQNEITAAAISAATPAPTDTDGDPDDGASAAPSTDSTPAEHDEPDVTVDSPVVTAKAAPAPDLSTLSADDEFRG